MLLENMTMEEFKSHFVKTKTILFPFGTVEEHGTHLPMNTDTLIVYEVLKKVAKMRNVFLAPPVYYGVCTTTGQHPGTIGIRPATLRRIVRDIVRDSYAKGLKNFFLVSGHGGGLHMSAMKEAGEELVEELEGINLAVISPYDILRRELSELADTPNDSHAGEIETSLVLALAPDLVKGSSKEEYPEMPRPFIMKDKLKYWPGGVWGDPSKASREKGDEAIRLIVDRIIEIIDMLPLNA